MHRKQFLQMPASRFRWVLFADEHVMVTKWNTINPRKDIDHGYSLYLPDEGFKISKFLKKDGSLHKWYCDIVEFYVLVEFYRYVFSRKIGGAVFGCAFASFGRRNVLYSAGKHNLLSARQHYDTGKYHYKYASKPFFQHKHKNTRNMLMHIPICLKFRPNYLTSAIANS